MFHKEILNSQQTEVLQLIGEFKREYYLVGGTAIALYLGHRRSIDFDMFNLISNPPSDEEIKAFLIEVSTEIK